MGASNQVGVPEALTSRIEQICALSGDQDRNKSLINELIAALNDVSSGLAEGQLDAKQACRAAISLYYRFEPRLYQSAVTGPLRTLGFDLGYELGLTQDEIWDIEEAVSDED